MNVFAEALTGYQNSTTTLKNPKKWFLDAVGGKTKSGIKVNERSALTLSAYFDGVNLLSNHIAYLPFHMIRRNAATANRDRLPDHPLKEILHWEANNQMSAFTLKKTMTIHMLNWGNAYAIIRRRGSRVTSLKLKKPWETRVHTGVDSDIITYTFKDENRVFTSGEVLHLHQFSLDGICGKSIIEAGARDRFGGHIAASVYGETFFGNGTHMGGILISEDSLGMETEVVNEAKSEVRKELENVYGGQDKWHSIGILDGKWEYKNMTLKASDAQLIERGDHTVEDVARWLGVPVTKLKATRTQNFNNREAEAIDYVQDGLQPRISIWLQEIRRKMLTAKEKEQGVEPVINAKDLMRGDLKSLSEFLKTMVDRAIFTPNDALEFLGEDNYEGGDVHLVPMNFTTLERLGDEPQNPQRNGKAKDLIQSTNGHSGN
jgi:HK97 family phage portal protein